MTKLRAILFPALLAAALLWLAPLAQAEDRDTVHIGHSIRVPSGSSVQDAVCIFCSVHVDGKVMGDVVTVFGSVHLNGDAQHDVVTIVGSIHAAPGSSIDDDAVSLFGVVHLGQDVHVGHDLVVLFGRLDRADTASIGGESIVYSALIVILPLAFIALLIALAARSIHYHRRRLALRNYPPGPTR